MSCNVGCRERSIRIVVGTVLVTLSITHNIGIWGWLGLVPLGTGLMRYCPLYSIIKKNGCCGGQCECGSGKSCGGESPGGCCK